MIKRRERKLSVVAVHFSVLLILVFLIQTMDRIYFRLHDGDKLIPRRKMLEIRESQNEYYRFAKRIYLAEEPYRTLLWICTKETKKELIHEYAQMCRFLQLRNLQMYWFECVKWDFNIDKRLQILGPP